MYNTGAPPRRKSCEACKTSKRRCDLAFPFCSRCVSRNQPCVYPGTQPSAYPDFAEDIPALLSPSNTWQAETLSLPFNLDLAFCPESNIAPNTSHMNDAQPRCPPHYLHRSQMLATRDDSAIPPNQHQPNLELVESRKSSLRPLPEIIATRLQFAVDVLKETPRMMVLQNQTPWCHPSLYKRNMPRVMQDAYACCSLYMSKTEINAPVIMSLFDDRTRDLLSSPEPTTTRDMLARTHALILYQIMRLFDSDIRSQATAEALFTTLEASVLNLMRTVYVPDRKEPDDLLPLSMDPIIEFWESWVLQESARRTVLLTYYFMQIYKLLQGRIPVQCDGKLGIYGDHAWYLSAHLWNAQSAFDFAVAWAEREHFIVYNLDFSSALVNAQPGDLDMFGRMLLVTILGIDETRAWFYVRGAIL